MSVQADERTTAPRPLLSSVEVARRLGVSPFTVRRLVDAGVLPAHRIGALLRYRPEDVEDYIRRQRLGRDTAR